MFGGGKVYPNCRNASNPYHECTEYCFKVITETKPRMDQSHSGTEMGPEFKACVKCAEKCLLVHGNKTDVSPVITSFVTVMSGEPVIPEENEETISTTSSRATKKCRTGDGSGGDEGIPGDQTFRPDLHPTFVVTMQDPSYLTTALKINLTFSEKYLNRAPQVNLQIPNGSTWPVICSVTNKEEERTRYNREGVPRNRYPSYCIKAELLADSTIREEVARIRYQGWIKFATDNGLQVGDTCVFEMIKQQPAVTLLVHIIRAV